jgi:hypothetical protein
MAPIVDQVIDFYSELFEHLFSEPFRPLISDRLKRKAVERQVEESSDAASQSLSRFLLNQQLSDEGAAALLAGLAPLSGLLDLERISNPNVTPESLAEELLDRVPVPEGTQEPIYRVALHSILQVLMLVGPVMAEWRKLGFASTFELPRRVVNRLNEISGQLDALGVAGESVADERYELIYRDYLLQRFHRVEAGTVRMTTSLNVDLRELFVMPRLKERPVLENDRAYPEAVAVVDFMGLAEARKLFTSRAAEREKEIPSALDQVRRCQRLVIVGVPGSGKSTYLEWLQLKVASVEEELVFAGQQAIPLLLRVRQLDAKNLPRGASLIERATASRDRTTLMPPGWIERQMEKGRVLLMLDGLDETEPELRDRFLLPWLGELCEQYPDCHYLISSRPVGYPPGALLSLDFVEADLMDFGKPEIVEYTRHWCTAIRLAQNEPEAEARSEGIAEGEGIVQSFQSHPYISNLARNPLMLSAICLVNYFEGGRLPKDRAMLYRLCVEGLLHHWDQRRGIKSEFTLDEKLRVCRTVALAMQSKDRAEFSANDVQEVVIQVLGEAERARRLLEHIQFRTGLLLERRLGVFAFAHLTFQEYLAACAIYQGNPFGIDAERLAQEYGDGRWTEVIALYCGLASESAARKMLSTLAESESEAGLMQNLSRVLGEAFLSSSPDITQNLELRRKVIRRLAVLPGFGSTLDQFPSAEAAKAANELLSDAEEWVTSGASTWLAAHRQDIDFELLCQRLANWSVLSSVALANLMYFAHKHGSDGALMLIAGIPGIYEAPAPSPCVSQAEIALAGLIDGIWRERPFEYQGVNAVFLQILEALRHPRNVGIINYFVGSSSQLLKASLKASALPEDPQQWRELARLSRQAARSLSSSGRATDNEDVRALDELASELEEKILEGEW